MSHHICVYSRLYVCIEIYSYRHTDVLCHGVSVCVYYICVEAKATCSAPTPAHAVKVENDMRKMKSIQFQIDLLCREGSSHPDTIAAVSSLSLAYFATAARMPTPPLQPLVQKFSCVLLVIDRPYEIGFLSQATWPASRPGLCDFVSRIATGDLG